MINSLAYSAILGSGVRKGYEVVAALFGEGDDGIILDPSDMSTMWQDFAKTQPVTAVGQEVAVIADRRGTGIEMVATASTRKPVLGADTNETKYLDFNEFAGMSYDGGALDFPQPSALLNVRSNSYNTTLFGRSFATTHSSPYFEWAIWTIGPHRWESRINGTIIGAPEGFLPLDVFTRIGIDPSAGKLYSNGAEHTFTPNDPIVYENSGKILLGLNASNGEEWRGRFYGGMVINRAITSDDKDAMAQWQIGD